MLGCGSSRLGLDGRLHQADVRDVRGDGAGLAYGSSSPVARQVLSAPAAQGLAARMQLVQSRQGSP